ncbi:MAG: hypothetical protein JWQ74_3610, partial [Marmoricola sp.]|nr:hypothetical protein [Marmoricola sp.]
MTVHVQGCDSSARPVRRESGQREV